MVVVVCGELWKGGGIMGMRVRTVAVWVVFLMLSGNAFGQRVDELGHEEIRTGRQSAVKKDAADLPPVAKLIVQQTNDFRKEQGLPAVGVDPKLTEAARYFADFMARTGKYGHSADGNQPADRARKAGYEYCIVAENIAYQYRSTGFAKDELGTSFVEGWENSPGHRKNMLDADVTETGVAVAQSQETGYYYAVQMFGRPKSQAIAFQLENESEETVEYKIAEQKFTLPPRYTRTHQVCRPVELMLELPAAKPGAKRETKTLRPASGDHFAIVVEKGSYQVKKE